MLNAHDRPMAAGMGGVIQMRLRSVDIGTMCEAYGASLEEFERIIQLEDEVYPVLAEKWASDAKSQSNTD